MVRNIAAVGGSCASQQNGCPTSASGQSTTSPLRGSKSRGAGRSYAGALIRGEAAVHVRERQDAQRQSHRIVAAELGEPDVAVVLLKFAEERASARGKRAPRCQAGRDKIDRQA